MRRVEFTETPQKPWPEFKPVKGEVYELSDDQAARAVKRGVARYLDEHPILPISDADAAEAEQDRLATIAADAAEQERTGLEMEPAEAAAEQTAAPVHPAKTTDAPKTKPAKAKGN